MVAFLTLVEVGVVAVASLLAFGIGWVMLLVLEEQWDCISCGMWMGDDDQCPSSHVRCGHHCDHSWTHDACCWCGTEWGEDGCVIEYGGTKL